MILILSRQAHPNDIETLMKRLDWMNLRASLSEQNGQKSLAVVSGMNKQVQIEEFAALPLVEKVLPFTQPYKLASKDVRRERLCIPIKDIQIGGKELAVMAGPCSIESAEQMNTIAAQVKKAGANILRGGAFKPRTSPYSFQGLGEYGLQILAEAGEVHNLITISEVMDAEQIDLVGRYVDILQIGARNMQNYSLLKKVGRSEKPVMIKRGFSSTYQDLLMSAEYILHQGNPHVILCERGVRTFENYTRNTLDIAAVPVLHQLSHLPVIVDPSHGTGIREMVVPMARASVAAGADGIMVEVHNEPEKALSDGIQSLYPEQFEKLMISLKQMAPVVDREIL